MRSEFFQALVRSLEDGIVVIDECGAIELVNPGLERLLGWREAELRGCNVSVLMPPEHAGRHDGYLQAYARTGQARIIGQDRVLQARHRNGENVDVMLSVTEVHQHGRRYYVGRLRDIRPQLRHERELQRLAFYDPVTGLRNSQALRRRLSGAAPACDPSRLHVLAIADIERFRILNDTAGHRIGDELLHQVGQRLQERAPAQAEVFRWTGDEFVLLAEAPDADGAAALIERWLRQATEHEFAVGPHRVRVRLRAGVRVCCVPAANPDEELARADLALVHAKRHGSAAVVDEAALPHGRDWTLAQLSQDLRQGLEAGQFTIHLQPQVDAQGHLVGAEALLRWLHPQRGCLPPGAFWTAAVELGLAPAIGLTAIRQTLELAQRWQADPSLARLQLSCNLSPQQFRCPDLVTHLRTLLQPAALRPGQVRLEITEEAVFDDEAQVQRTLDELGALGFGLSLDDFGTGYSSLQRLLALPLAELKIDRAFVAALGRAPRAEPIVQAILAIGQALQVDCVAEGVETPDQWQRLRTLGCQRFQGFAWAPPMPAQALEALARRDQPLTMSAS